MEPEGSLLCSQQPATDPNAEPDESSPHSPTCFPNIQFNIILHRRLGFLSALFPSGSVAKILYSFLIPLWALLRAD
jgi:hypothetical protein